jgi:phage tail protein X
MTTTEYITKPGDRWDLIAYRAYGTLNLVIDEDGNQVSPMGLVIRANRDIAVTDVLQEGILLQIPIIAAATLQTDLSLLPPWKTN